MANPYTNRQRAHNKQATYVSFCPLIQAITNRTIHYLLFSPGTIAPELRKIKIHEANNPCPGAMVYMHQTLLSGRHLPHKSSGPWMPSFFPIGNVWVDQGGSVLCTAAIEDLAPHCVDWHVLRRVTLGTQVDTGPIQECQPFVPTVPWWIELQVFDILTRQN